MTDEKHWPTSAPEPFLWAFYQQLPGGNGRMTLCTVRSREDADYLRENGIDVFPLYVRPVRPVDGDRFEPASGREAEDIEHRATESGSGANGRTAADLKTFYGFPHDSDAERHGAGSGFGSHPKEDGSDIAQHATSSFSILVGQIERMRDALRPFARMAELVEGKEDSETLFSMQAGPLQWRHITAGDLRRAGRILTPSGG